MPVRSTFAAVLQRMRDTARADARFYEAAGATALAEAKRLQAAALSDAVGAAADTRCTWRRDNDEGLWQVDCCARMFEFTGDGGPVDHGFAHCPYCGRLLHEGPWRDEADDEEDDE